MSDQQDDKGKIYSILNKIQSEVQCGNLEEFKQLIQAMEDIQDKTLLNSCYNNEGINLITLICKYNNRKILRYLLHQTHILLHLSINDKSKELESKENAFYFAMRSNDFGLLEMLYDYWSGSLHWLGHVKEYNQFDIENLNQLNEMLTNAFNKYEEHIQVKKKVDQLMMFNIQGLMAFNDFQRDIYKKLNKLKKSLISWEDEPKDIIRKQESYAIRSMVLTIINMYEKYSNKDFYNTSNEDMVQKNEIGTADFPDDNPDDLVEWKTDTGIINEKTYFYFTREVYFRKLDFNVCLLILDNLHLLKLRLSIPKNSYQKLENTLYHFYHHVYNNWSLYFPKRKKNKVCKLIEKYKSTSCIFTLNYNANKWEPFPELIYFERRDFVKSLHRFKKELQNVNIEENIREEKIKLPIEDVNYLVLVPELRDNYSLKLMSQVIAKLYSVDVNEEYAVLLIERTLQVIGEFLKSTNESLHLEPSTEALLKVETSVEVINDLKKLRDMLAHAKNSMLLKRIELEKNNRIIFEKVREELLYIKPKLDKIIKVHKPLVHKALLLNMKSILCEKRNEMLQIGAKLITYMLNVVNEYDNGKFYENILVPFEYFKSILQEGIMHIVLFIVIDSKLFGVNKTINNNISCEFPIYKEMIEKSVKYINECKKIWQEIVKKVKDQNPSAELSDYPNEKDANRIKSYSENYNFCDDSGLFTSIENHWNFIGNLLDFIVVKSCIFKDTIEDTQIYTHLKELKEYEYQTKEVQQIITDYLNKIKERLEKINGTSKTLFHQHAQPPPFFGIKELTNKLSKPNFLTKEEKNHLIDTVQNISANSDRKKNSKRKMMVHIENDRAIKMTNYRNFVNSAKLDEKTQKILINLVMGHVRYPCIVHCLSYRISLLKQVTKNQTVNELVLRYKLDKTFRICLEILLFDIFDILESHNKNTLIVKKLSKLLMEINLRNILIHGNPLLDVVGVILDSNDLPTALVTKAVDFIEDKPSIDALCALRDSDFLSQPNNIMTPEQKAWDIKFRESPRWKDYILLIPEVKKKDYDKRKKMPAVVDINTELLHAVHKKDYLLVQKTIGEGANVNFVDTHKKAVIHYAAMKGDIHLMEILLNNKADVNIGNQENKLTALHYSVMNNFEDAVEFLLQKKADCLALDNKGRTPIYLANQKNLSNVSRILQREMRKREMTI